MKAPLDPKRIEEARALRKSGLSYVQIGKRLGCSDNCVRKYCTGVQINVPNAPSCPKCGQILPAGERFCYMCGTQILTEREKIIRNLENLRSIAMLIPETSRDSALAAVNGAVNYLKNLED